MKGFIYVTGTEIFGEKRKSLTAENQNVPASTKMKKRSQEKVI